MSKNTHFNDRDLRIQVIDDERKIALFLDDFKLQKPSPGIFDAPYKCYTINDQWAKIVFGLVGWLATVAPWQGAEDENHPAILEILKFLSQDNQCMYQLRQSPTDNCILEQSTDGGTTWTTAFDYSLCINNSTWQPVYEDLSNTYQGYIDTWQGTVATTYPDLVYDNSPDDQLRDFAICVACYDYVWNMSIVEKKRRQAVAQPTIIAGATIAVLASALTIFSVGLATPLIIGLAGMLTFGTGLAIHSLTLEVFNTDTIADVACCMFNSIKNGALSETNWKNSLANCNYPFGSYEAQLAGAIDELIGTDQFPFEAFVGHINQVYQTPTDPRWYCPCDEIGTWTSVLDLTTSSYGFTFLLDAIGEDQGTWTNGIGLRGAVSFVDGANDIRLFGSWFVDETTITSIQVEGSFKKGGIPGFASGYVGTRQAIKNNTVTQTEKTTVYTGWSSGTTLPYDYTTTNNTLSDEIHLFFRPSIQATDGIVTITTVTIQGLGIKPSQLP